MLIMLIKNFGCFSFFQEAVFVKNSIKLCRLVTLQSIRAGLPNQFNGKIHKTSMKNLQNSPDFFSEIPLTGNMRQKTWKKLQTDPSICKCRTTCVTILNFQIHNHKLNNQILQSSFISFMAQDFYCKTHRYQVTT